jgi:hypothetical protein
MVRTDTTGGGTFTTETKGHNLANEYTSKNGQSYYDHRCLCQLPGEGLASWILSLASRS